MLPFSIYPKTALLQYQIDRLAENIHICNEVAKKIAQMEFTILYLAEVLDCMREACETALQVYIYCITLNIFTCTMCRKKVTVKSFILGNRFQINRFFEKGL